MPLKEHMRELRDRLLKSVIAVVAVTVLTTLEYRRIMAFLLRPLLTSVGCTDTITTRADGRPCAQVTTEGLVGPFSVALQVGVSAGIVLSAPIWLYQVWAFVAPALHAKEKKYALGFVAAGAPLFGLGAWLAYRILPATAHIALQFTPDNVQNLLPVAKYLDLVTRMTVVFGLAFELPLLLVLLNLTGILSARRLAGWWRGMVMGITVFAAFATPGGDPPSMLALAVPILLLYLLALAVCALVDHHRHRHTPPTPTPDTPSPLPTPQDIT
ncbi:twin-arginine translocase subunit TatC [Streptomyces sp. BI20]|uniref:twin-arginine translocase subunit TatC n=1 Tax=Streptomyces sp. BI20 TaxID=3403460 RepID=UPI003C70DB99